MADEQVYLQTDTTFNILLQILNEAIRNGTLVIKKIQQASIDKVKSKHGSYEWNNDFNFAKTTSACFRMAWMKACGIPNNLWPSISPAVYRYNAGLLQDGQEFVLTIDEDTADEYTVYFDQLYHYNRIRRSLRTGHANIPSMMVIVREDEVIVINITASVREVQNEFHAYIHVNVMICDIKDPLKKLQKKFDELKFKEECEEMMKTFNKMSLSKDDKQNK